MTDIHAMALESARKTLSENQLQGEVYASDVFSDVQGKFDLIISNPPFHDGIDTAYRAVTELITQAKWHLNQGGELRIVANSFLPYPELLRQHFNDYQVLAQTGKFKVYSVKVKTKNPHHNNGDFYYRINFTALYSSIYPKLRSARSSSAQPDFTFTQSSRWTLLSNKRSISARASIPIVLIFDRPHQLPFFSDLHVQPELSHLFHKCRVHSL